jgi:hypothetical protein
MLREMLGLRLDFTCAPALIITQEKGPRIRAAVGAGSPPRCMNHPDDVKAIQAALNQFPPIFGGPAPALKVDGKCGPLTRAAILHFQRKWRGLVTDGIVDVDGHTIRRLREGSPAPTPPPALLVANLGRISEVVTASIAVLDMARDYLAGPNVIPGFNKAAFEKVDRQFHLGLLREPLGRLAQIRSVFQSMVTAIGHIPEGIVLAADEPPEIAVHSIAFSFSGGIHLRATSKRYWGKGDLDTGAIYLCPFAHTLDPESLSYVMIHELAHYAGPVSPGIRDVAYFHRDPQKFRQLGPGQALWNADSYAQFAFAAAGRPD